jgi:hypothetical protein
MEGKLENKIWWFIYNEVQVHPDDYSIDFTSPQTVEASLKSEGLGEWEVPKGEAKPDQTFTAFCTEAAMNSILVDKDLAFRHAMLSPKVKELWENCDPADAPQVDNEILASVGGRLVAT